ncbi:ABC transporter [Microbacterium sp. Y-01]|uniref:dipeptide/oligopeptide/nickel ABC transporter permease/ATP-binding protein n=1 Tax=Microbacterium sp. Y-01 TaxID=2048898 RepID=UPI000F5EBDD2|nr:dipeptide/oligopeptide/nickel ABC transporter permease/ATP-binding protein [Microbacterium sp. Y-01]AZH79023.1 ABC transporter [Microbacterium sp. Y-01]
MTVPLTPVPGAPPQNLLRRVLANPLGLGALIVLGVLVIVAVVGPWVAPWDPNYSQLSNALQPPGAPGHLLGTDSAGRDVFSRLLIGTRTTLIAAAIAASVAALLGVPSGLVAGYAGGKFDAVASWLANVILALPSIIALLAATAALGSSVLVSMTVFGIMMSPTFFRLTRTAVRSVRGELYVDAARVSGLGPARIVGRHIFFVVRAPLVVQLAVVAGISISIQSGLEFLGLGDPLTPSWGVMLNEAFVNIYADPVLLVWPSVMIVLAIGSFIVLSNAVRDALEYASPVAPRRRPQPLRAVSELPTASAARHDGHLLEVTGLAVGYPQPGGDTRTVVQDVSFHVDRGEVVGLVGESGSGKSQTAFAVLGLLPSEAHVLAGAIVFDGEDLRADRGRRGGARHLLGRRIAYVPQEPMSNLDPNYTIGRQLTRPLRVAMGLSRGDARARALELLAAVGMRDPERTFRSYPHEISGGMAQRVLIAGAISCRPDLLIADEPTTALDVTVQAEILDLLRRLQHDLGMGMLMVTHNFGVVADICDRVLVMDRGTLAESGPVRSVLRSPQSSASRALLLSSLAGREPLTPLSERGAALQKERAS